MPPTNSTELGLEDILTFGKHKDKQLEDVIEDDPSYISYLVMYGVVGFDEETCELISKKGIV